MLPQYLLHDTQHQTLSYQPIVIFDIQNTVSIFTSYKYKYVSTCNIILYINNNYIIISAGNSPDGISVGYSGYANSQSLGYGDLLNFPNQLCNVGNQFSRNRFTCPYTGIYFVSVTYCRHPSTSSSYSVDAHLYRGDTHIFSSHDRYHPYHYVTNNALVRCNRGNYIGTKAGGPSYLYGSGSYPESIFTVMSLHQEGNYAFLLVFSYSMLLFL